VGELGRGTLSFLKKSLQYVDYLIFLVLIMAKLYVFARWTDTTFVPMGVGGYLKAVYDFLFHGGDFTPVRHGVVMVSLGATILISFWTLFFRRRGRLMALVVLDAIISFIIFADLIYFRYFSDLISSTVLLQIKQVSSLETSISALFSMRDLLMGVDLVLWIPLCIYLSRKWKDRSKSKRSFIEKLLSWSLLRRVVLAAAIFGFGYFCAFYPVKMFIEKGGGYLFTKTISNMRVYEVTGLLGFHGYDTFKYLDANVFHKKEIPPKRLDAINQWFTKHREDTAPVEPVVATTGNNPNQASLYGMEKGKNVIIVQMEAFNSFVIDKKINGQVITPNLNELKKHSMYFNNFYHQTANGRTSDAEFLMNTSLYPLYTGSAYIKYSGNKYTALPETLAQHGYTTAAYHAYKPSFWNRYLMYQDIGYQKFHSVKDFKDGPKIGWSITDESFLTQSADKISNMKKPYLAFLITISSHYPFDIPEKYKTLDLSGYKDKNFKNYIQAVHYVDGAMGTFIDDLKAKGIWDNSVVMMYGDHDSGLWEPGNEMAKFATDPSKPLSYYQEKDQIPFFIHLPNDEKAGEYDQVGGQIDIMPSVLYLLGIPEDGLYIMGTPLFEADNRLVVFRHGSFTTNDVYYKASLDVQFDHGTCYDTKTGQETSLSRCKPASLKAQKQLSISDDIIYGNLIKNFKDK
jgi:lipoteichoic acid synthase